MKLPFTWILSSWWQNNTNTIRTILNMTKKQKKNNVFLLQRQKLGSNQSTFVTFSDKKLTNFQSSLQRVWNYLSHEYCQVDGKTTQTPSQRLWTWLNNRKKQCFFAKTAKVGIQSKYFCDVFRQKTHELSIIIANSMKLPFTWSLSSWWQNNTNTIRTILNTTEKRKKNNVFC